MSGLGMVRRLVSQEDSAHIESARVPRSRFMGSWTRKMAFDAGILYPFLVDEVLPGDHMKYNVTAYVRMSTPSFPLFDNQRIDTFFFYVPNRLLWDKWARFMGEQESVGQALPAAIPLINVDAPGFTVGSLGDHFGIPVGIPAVGTAQINALPFRAWNQIYNSWFRDENLMAAKPVNKGDGPDAMADYGLYYRAKAHDYFTSALPWPQKFTAPTLPITGQALVKGIGVATAGVVSTPTPSMREPDGFTGTFPQGMAASTASQVFVRTVAGMGTLPSIYADLSTASSIDINTLRNAWLVQGLLERDARGGSRYVELIRSHFGVVNPDFRLNRPEYIGGGNSPLNITPIAQTAPTTGVPLGALGAAGSSAGQHSASYAATEHGFIIGIINVRSEVAYQQGLHKMWNRDTRFKYYWPSLAGLGEQAINTSEIYWQHGAGDAVVFGYQERWQEYRTRTSEVTGIMRSGVTGTLDAWHLTQRFLSAPVLGEPFLHDAPPMTRVLVAAAQATGQQYMADILIQRTATRPIPMYGTPVTLGRF